MYEKIEALEEDFDQMVLWFLRHSKQESNPEDRSGRTQMLFIYISIGKR